ncbi:CDP-alcohol phosphatidyltransferase family protein [Flavobacteriaceae bacterium S356]|uniref:CDP-alcohol phosphatidyltransferase family protein n=1 Tax=Asprobacillus argus TaxID=3076534 RepID=A0ABU3LE36_9FLAO|nr:CDP-alcohol phosphatidyltransferase family protein [Flavobacteriaceae bacterium S356]
MNLKKHIPNLFTLGNLFCGTLATMAAVERNYKAAALLVVIGIIFDFFDGFLARILKVQGELGKQLDSLADMVTSGVVPGILMFRFYEETIQHGDTDLSAMGILMAFSCFLLTLAAGYRLAKFNIDTRQSESFIGLPTPAMSLFVISLPIIYEYTTIEFVKNLVFNNYFLISVSIILSVLMNVNIRLFSLKFKKFGFRENIMKYILLFTSLILIITLQYLAVPLIIVLYVLLSILQNTSNKSSS